MATAYLGKKSFTPTAPIKGSFPLDHDGVCKTEMVDYMICVTKNRGNNDECRDHAKKYFECRMENQLMAREDWVKLGYGDLPSSEKEVAK